MSWSFLEARMLYDKCSKTYLRYYSFTPLAMHTVDLAYYSLLRLISHRITPGGDESRGHME